MRGRPSRSATPAERVSRRGWRSGSLLRCQCRPGTYCTSSNCARTSRPGPRRSRRLTSPLQRASPGHPPSLPRVRIRPTPPPSPLPPPHCHELSLRPAHTSSPSQCTHQTMAPKWASKCGPPTAISSGCHQKQLRDALRPQMLHASTHLVTVVQLFDLLLHGVFAFVLVLVAIVAQRLIFLLVVGLGLHTVAIAILAVGMGGRGDRWHRWAQKSKLLLPQR